MTFAVHDTHFPRSSVDPQPSGTWKLVYEKGQPAAIVTCPICGSGRAISSNRLAPSGGFPVTGAVDAAVHCEPTCGWFNYLVLDGWAEAIGTCPP